METQAGWRDTHCLWGCGQLTAATTEQRVRQKGAPGARHWYLDRESKPSDRKSGRAVPQRLGRKVTTAPALIPARSSVIPPEGEEARQAVGRRLRRNPRQMTPHICRGPAAQPNEPQELRYW